MSLAFPSSINLSQHPIISFKCLGDIPGFGLNPIIFLPVPRNLNFTDGATYNDTELGLAGKMLSGAIQEVKNKPTNEAVAALGTRAASIVKNMDVSKLGATGALYAAGKFGNDKTAAAVGIGLGATLNKNITTEFTATGTRTYTFSFNLIPYSRDDANTIRQIVRLFRLALYPINEDFFLRYPPKWQISFLKCENYVPRIFETYLTEVNLEYNSAANMWREDGAPMDTTIGIQFTETRALTREDIINLEK
jgi:hypothetical protein